MLFFKCSWYSFNFILALHHIIYYELCLSLYMLHKLISFSCPLNDQWLVWSSVIIPIKDVFRFFCRVFPCLLLGMFAQYVLWLLLTSFLSDSAPVILVYPVQVLYLEFIIPVFHTPHLFRFLWFQNVESVYFRSPVSLVLHAVPRPVSVSLLVSSLSWVPPGCIPGLSRGMLQKNS